jgi:acetylornithine deacetylase/succinyl-diaminopimelate desuccinylase-like protein
MTDPRTSALQYAHEHRQEFLNILKEFAGIPSISADPAHKADIQRAAEWVAGRLHALGMKNVTIYPTAGHPVVYGTSPKAGLQAPTVLVYGHYDVQPPEPLEKWQSGPFEPTVRGENLYGRGVSDMKGQVMASLAAIESIVRTGELPVNIKMLIEGEEEVGSPNLEQFIPEHKDLLACDAVLNPDAGMIAADIPSVTYGLRGLAYFEVRVYGPSQDLHSGSFGGTIHNPAQVLCELVAAMHDENGRVTLPGFYGRVRQLSEEERRELARVPTDEAFFKRASGVPALWGEPEYTPAERVGARPTLEINGLLSGYTGAGAKTVLPAYAMAKISTRLVPDQDPKEVYGQLKHFLEAHAPKTVRWELQELVGGPASLSDRHSAAVQSLSRAIESVWGKRPVFVREGGSVPVVAQFQQHLGVDSVNTGFSLLDDGAHSPNEKLHLPTFYRGIDALIHFFFNLGSK